jgi:N-acetyl-gamma-glutamyl-phosphate reductase
VREHADAPVSAGIESGSIAGIAGGSPATAATGMDRRPAPGGLVRVGIVGATGYVGAELIRILSRHPRVEIVGLQGRDRHGDPIGGIHAHLAGTGLAVESDLPDVDAVFLALPHGASSALAAAFVERGTAVIDLGPDFRLGDPADYPTWYGFEHTQPTLLGRAVYGLPEINGHRDQLSALRHADVAVVGNPGCYPTATLLAIAPLARAGLIDGLVVDAKSGVSGAGRDPKPDLMFGEVNDSVKAYGVDGHRHTAEIEQELAALGGPDGPVTFLPHLIPMTRGILSACHVLPTAPVEQAALDELYHAAYDDEPFVTVVDAPPATKHVLGSNHARVFVRHDPRTGRILAIGVIDNLVKGAAGQAIQAFNLVHGLPETLGLEQLPLAP